MHLIDMLWMGDENTTYLISCIYYAMAFLCTVKTKDGRYAPWNPISFIWITFHTNSTKSLSQAHTQTQRRTHKLKRKTEQQHSIPCSAYVYLFLWNKSIWAEVKVKFFWIFFCLFLLLLLADDHFSPIVCVYVWLFSVRDSVDRWWFYSYIIHISRVNAIYPLKFFIGVK